MVDKNQNIYIGQALIDAYRDAEKQGWIGLILTEKAEQQIVKISLDPSHHNFDKHKVPHKGDGEMERYVFNVTKGDKNILNTAVTRLEYMRDQVASKDLPENEKDKIILKYNNTIRFIKSRSLNSIHKLS
jgi:hypothetical protein